jgi:hypothetical protein
MVLLKVHLRLGDARWLCCAGRLTQFHFVKMSSVLVCSRRHLAIHCGQQTGTEITLDISEVLLCEFRFHLLECWPLSYVSEAMNRFMVELKVPRYVMLGGSALLQCEYNVLLEQLHRVEWLRNRKKIFQFVKGRTPPFRNYSIPGAELDVS